ncbi:unnamed protein product, partial [Mycena citricolor]
GNHARRDVVVVMRCIAYCGPGPRRRSLTMSCASWAQVLIVHIITGLATQRLCTVPWGKMGRFASSSIK